MKKLRLFFLLGNMLVLGITPVAAQNSVDVLGGGPQPLDAPMPAAWSSTSNANPTPMDITGAITANYYFMPNGGGTPLTPLSASGLICLADTKNLLATTLFAQIAADCQAGGGVATIIFPAGGITAPANIPVFSMALGDGTFLENTVGYATATNISNFPIRINVSPTPANPTGQHNCPASQAVPAFVGPGTANYTPNESLCLPAGAGQAVEPSMIVDSQGTVYVESIRGVPGGLDLWRWYKTADGGPNADGTLPFKYEGHPDGCGIFPANTICTTANVAPGGGDGDVAVNTPDPLNMNIPNLAVVILSAAEVTATHSTNRADNFTSPAPNVAAADVPFDDRMWIDAFDDPSHVYMEYHDFGSTSQIFVQRSSDGGQTYTDAVGVVDAATEASVGPPTGNVAGQIKVDHTSSPSRGNLYQIFLGPDNPTDNSHNSSNFINAAYVGVATNVSLTNPVITFTDYKIFSCGAGSNCPSGLGLGNIFPALAVDSFGYVYAAWSDNTNIYYSYSTTHGTTWSPAIKVTDGTTQAGMSNVFPWIAAEANGHVAIAWYGADHAGNSNTVPLTTKWNAFVAETVNGHAATPVFTLSQASDHVNHTGQISTTGFNPNGSDRSLADFFQIGIDPTNHLINVAYADNHAGTAVSYFTRQKKATPGIQGCGHEVEGEGDERGRDGGKATFRVHHDDCDPQADSADFSDPGSGTDFHSTQVNSVVFNNAAHSVTITGLGTDNGSPVAFTIVAVDSSLVPPGLFSITLSDGYTDSGNLLDGSITLH